MAFIPGYKSRYYAGPSRLSAQGKSFSASVSAAMLEVPTEDRAKGYIYGQKDGDYSIDMALDTAYATPAQITTLLNWRTTGTPVTCGLAGVAVGDLVWMVNGISSGMNVNSAAADVVAVTTGGKMDGGADWGYVVDAETAITTDTTGFGMSDGSAGSTNGGVAHLHVTAFSGLTSDAITLEHSTNFMVWSTLGTFTTVTGTGSERLVIAAATTVNQYLRVVDNVTGTGSCTRIVTFARR